MKTWIRLPILVATIAAATAAHARPEFPGQLDQRCAAAGRTPADPAALARAGVTLGDCTLCHDFDLTMGQGPSGGNVTAVGDAWQSDLDPFCTLAPANAPPVLDPVGNQSVPIGQLLQVLVTGSDSDGESLTFTADSLPTGASLVGLQPGVAVFEWVPDASQVGIHPITFSVSDGRDMDSESIVVTAGDVNAPPALDPIGDQVVFLGETLLLALSASDPEGGPLSWAAEGLPPDATFAPTADGMAELTWAPAAPASQDVTVTVTDSGTPPEATEETFALSALDPALALRIDRARWKRNKLKVRGAGATPEELVTLLEADSGAELGSKRAKDSGAFRMSLRPFLAPCAVRAVSSAGMSPAFEVDGVPDDCGQLLLARVREAEWDCEDFELEVRGDRAPPESMVRAYDADRADVLLAEGQSDRKGRFRIEATLAAPPARIEVGVTAGDTEFRLLPVAPEREDCDLEEDGGSEDPDDDEGDTSEADDPDEDDGAPDDEGGDDGASDDDPDEEDED